MIASRPPAIPHYIWHTSDKQSNDQYERCTAKNLPTVIIYKNGRGFVRISYDTLSMFGDNLKETEKQLPTVKQVMKMYKSYSKVFMLPDDQFQASGGEDAFGFVVKKEHADFLAEGLYHFLLTRKP
jgi:hypothetical protein